MLHVRSDSCTVAISPRVVAMIRVGLEGKIAEMEGEGD